MQNQTLKGKRILVIDDHPANAQNWSIILQRLMAEPDEAVGPDITDLRARVAAALDGRLYDGVVLDVLLAESTRDAIPDNRIAGIVLWELLERDFRARGVDLNGVTGPVLLTTKNDRGDAWVRSMIENFCATHPGADVCWSSVPDHRVSMAIKVFS